MELFLELLQRPVVMRLVSTVVLLVAVIVLRAIAARAIRRSEGLPKDVRRRWLVQVRNAALAILLLGLVMIWAEELRLFAVSILAVAVATAIATKDLIQCLSGSALKVAGKSFKIGDRIEVAGVRGDVIDHNAMTTTILETGPASGVNQLTGRAVVLPNSVFLGKPLVNESFVGDIALHSLRIPLKADADWTEAEVDLLAAAQHECAPYLEEARRHFGQFAKREGLSQIAAEPRVAVTIPKAGELELVLRVSVPVRRKGAVEQAILRRYLALLALRSSDGDQQAAEALEEPDKAEVTATGETSANASMGN
jgi:small-conductance mechanosensitive channel